MKKGVQFFSVRTWRASDLNIRGDIIDARSDDVGGIDVLTELTKDVIASI